MSSSLPSAGIRFLISAFLLTSVLQLMASSESIRFTASRSPDVLRASIPVHPCHFLMLPLPQACDRRQFLLGSELRSNSRVNSRELPLLSTPVCRSPLSAPALAVSAAGAHSRHHAPYSKRVGISPCEIVMS